MPSIQTPILSAIIALAPTLALADASLNCSAYAGIAVAQQEQNQALGCGFAGAAWSGDFQAHFQWCSQATVKMANLTAEDNARKAQLQDCAARPQKAQEACIPYAQNAVLAFNMANKAQCGLSGGAWGDDFAGHFNWCLGASPAARDSETAARANQLQGCLAVRQSIRETECSGYAEAAVIQNQSNIERKCGFSGGAWSNDAAGHYGWCITVDKPAAEAANAARNAALATQCPDQTVCWSETRAVVGIPPWKVVRICRTQ